MQPPQTTGSELAQRLGVNRATVYNWRTGRTRPSRLARERLVALGVIILLPPKRTPARAAEAHLG